MKVSLVAAVARGGIIGRAGGIPWRIPEDVAHFKELTTGHAVVMGRKTWDSLPDRFRPLPGRQNVVVTRDAGWRADGADRVGSVAEALDLLAKQERVFVIGGAEIYTAALPYADELVLTEIELDVDGDTEFPHWNRQAFEETSRDERVSWDGTRFSFTAYRRWTADAEAQLSTLASITALLDTESIAYWLFGGWAVDFYAGRVTRRHDDIDLAVWLDDVPRIDALLRAAGWAHAPEPDEDGGTGYERDRVRLELTYLRQAADSRIVIPLRDGGAAWPDGAFGVDTRTLGGASAQLIALAVLRTGKSSPRDEDDDAAKDVADSEILSRL